MTKYVGGHSDIVGGAIVVRDPELAQRLQFLQSATSGDSRSVFQLPGAARHQDAAAAARAAQRQCAGGGARGWRLIPRSTG
ncbi:MAG: PLP-dependent transferase [Rhodopseudomonas palustris]|nr:PLP-dependent transferase [Rhodopseudomonas palustris]